MTTAPQGETPDRRLTPECRVGRTEPGFRHGCPACPAPGYQHPVLGWMPVSCACACHAGPPADGPVGGGPS
jgi:hypothetical protein